MSQPLFFRTKAHVLICTGPSCVRRGAKPVFEKAWNEMEKRRLAYYAGGDVRLTESGCQGACHYGPNAIAYYGAPGGGIAEAWYHDLDEGDLLEIVERLDRGEPPGDDKRYDR